MTEADNIGTLIERKRRQRYWALLIVAGLIGAAMGAADIFEHPEDSIAPGLAIALVAGLTAVLIGGNWFYHRYVDELEWANNVAAGFWGWNALVLAYPAWLLLWKGRIAPEPDLSVVYGISIGVAGIVYLWKRFF